MEVKQYGRHLMRYGFSKKASDLYVFPTKEGYRLSFRYLHHKVLYSQLKQAEGEKLILYFKYLADMDVAEKRRNQVGAASLRLNKKTLRLRFSTVADFQNRESLVIRFLHDFSLPEDYLCLLPSQFAELKEALKRTGLFLFSGPTGSGKTTTMYQLARLFEEQGKQVITIEDPVEIQEHHFLQLQVNHKIALNYQELVKVCLRHRPDLLIVGEIRDQETAQAVIRGALTGHTIFSTIHGLNKASIIPRLLELGVTAEEIRQSLQGIIYQRLFPLKCPYCQQDCSVYCLSRGSGVLFDTIFFKEGIQLSQKKNENWNKNLQKVWAQGFISNQTYEQERAEKAMVIATKN